MGGENCEERMEISVLGNPYPLDIEELLIGDMKVLVLAFVLPTKAAAFPDIGKACEHFCHLPHSLVLSADAQRLMSVF